MDKTMTRGLAFVAGLWLMGASNAQAQVSDVPKIFVSVNVGAQSHTHSITTFEDFTIYAEPAAFSSTQGVSGGFLFDVGIGYRVLDNLAIAISGSRTTDTSEATMVADIPHPVFFDLPKRTTATIDGLDRREVGIHLQAMWFLPVSGFLPGFRLAFTAGPSFFAVRQDLVTSVTVPAGTQDAVPVVETETKSSVGVNVGLDIGYPLAARIGPAQMGVGAFVRYAGSSFDFDAAEDDKAGGFQFGGGVRLGFDY